MTARLAESIGRLTVTCRLFGQAMFEAARRMGELGHLLRLAHHDALRWRLLAEACRVKELGPGRRQQRAIRRLRRMVIARAREGEIRCCSPC